MRSPLACAAWLTVFILVLASTIFGADTVKLVDGAELKGKITQRTATSITIEVEGAERAVRMEDIASINGERVAASGAKRRLEEPARGGKQKRPPVLRGDKSFTDLGIPVQSLTLAMDQAVAQDGGREKVYTVSYDPSGPIFVIEADPDTGDSQTYPAPVDAHDVYGFTLGKDDKLYFCTKEGAHFLSFNIHKKLFEELSNPAKPGYFYRMTAGPDGRIYGGVYQTMMLAEYDPQTKKSRLVCKLDEDNRYPHSMVFGRDGLLYVGCGAEKARVVAFDPRTEKVSDVLPEEKRVPGFCDVYRVADGRVEARLNKGGQASQTENFVADNGRCSPTEYLRTEEPTLRDGRRIQIDGPGVVLHVRPKDGGVREVPLKVDRGGAEVLCLANGPDGNTYGGTYPLNLFRLDPRTERLENLGNASGTSGEIYSMTSLQGRLYMANYPRGNLSVYDPKRPYKLGPNGRASKEKDANPRDLGSIESFQHRPVAMIVGPDEKIYIGVMGDYGSNTGSLTRFDPESEQFKIHQPYQDEHVTGLAVTPAKELWCVSTKHLFLWDCRTEKISFEMEMPRGVNARLRLCKNGFLYGVNVTGNILYAFDPKRRRIVSEVEIPWGQPPNAHWNGLDVGPDGRAYGIAIAANDRRILYVVDPQTHKPKKLGEHSGIQAGWAFTKKSIYLCAGSHVVKFALSR